jgi:hypothetical protein
MPVAQGDTIAMSEPLIVVIPHRLGKDEALRRIKDGIGRAKTEFAWYYRSRKRRGQTTA